MENTSFLPGTTTQFVWDSTSLGALKTCPRYYYYTIVKGYRKEKTPPPLAFGILFHIGQEQFQKNLAAGFPHDESIRNVIKFLAPRLEELEYPVPDTSRTPLTLIRALVWHFDKFKDSELKTVFIGGAPAVELSFKLPFLTINGVQTYLSGHLDWLVSFQDDLWFVDFKTTKYELDNNFFNQFSPSNQIDIYTLATKVVLAQEAKGGIIDGIQLSPNFNRFRRHMEIRSPEQVDEFVEDTLFWINQAFTFSENKTWPKNETSCSNYGGCVFRGICSKTPGIRDHFLKTEFIQKIWDPNIPRG